MRKLLVLVLLLVSPSWANPQLSGGNPDRGLPLYSAYCAGCHGFDGQGDGPMAARLVSDSGVRPMDLSDPEFQDRNTDAQLADLIRSGGKTHSTGYMPAWGLTLSTAQMTDLVAYLRELRNPDRKASARAFNIQDVLDRGRVLYGLRCLACHGPEGHGDGPFMQHVQAKAANLAGGMLRDFSDTKIMEVITRGLAHTGLQARPEAAWWERPLDAVEMQSLVFYLRTLPIQDSTSSP